MTHEEYNIMLTFDALQYSVHKQMLFRITQVIGANIGLIALYRTDKGILELSYDFWNDRQLEIGDLIAVDVHSNSEKADSFNRNSYSTSPYYIAYRDSSCTVTVQADEI